MGARHTAEVLFDMVDTDSSGVLEKAEFVYMHTMVLNSEKRGGKSPTPSATRRSSAAPSAW